MNTTVSGQRVPPEDVEPAFRRFVDAYAGAQVAAVADNGLFCDIPPQVDIGELRPAEARAGIELVAPESRAIVLEQFRQLDDKGAMEIEVRLANGNPGRYALFDTRSSYGVILLVVIEGTPDGQQTSSISLADMAPVRPRYGRVKRTEMSELIEADEATLGMLGYSADEFAGFSSADLVHPDDYGMIVGHWFDLLTAPPGSTRRARVRYRRSDGSWLWVEITFTQRLDDPEQPHMISEMVDISEEMAAMDEVWESRELLLRLTEALPVGVLQIDADGHVLHANDRLHGIVGVDRADTLTEQLASIIDEDRPALDDAVHRVLDSGADVDLEYRFRREHSHCLRYAQVAVRALRDRADAVTGAILCVTDVTDATQMRKELERRASYDLLTGCYNRATVMSELDRLLEAGNATPAVVFVDLDAFKPINDRLGHAAGDDLLKAVAAALSNVVRGNDIVGRLGGDEFLVICPNVSTRELAQQVGERVAGAVHFDTVVGGETVAVRASIGVAWTDASDKTADALVAEADAAMYESKRRGDHHVILRTPPPGGDAAATH